MLQYIEITASLASAYDFYYARVVRDAKRTSQRSERGSFTTSTNVIWPK